MTRYTCSCFVIDLLTRDLKDLLKVRRENETRDGRKDTKA